MSQPSGKVALAALFASEYFWYAHPDGMWDAHNSVLLAKTGSGAMAVEGGVNVALGNNGTIYSLVSALNIPVPCTILWGARTGSGAGNASMPWGNGAGTDCFAWMDRSGSCDVRIPNSGGYASEASFTSSSPSTMAKYAIAIAANGAYAVYKISSTAVETGTLSGTGHSLKVSELLDGYTGTSFSLTGALEFVSIVPSQLDSTAIASRFADPYQVLAAGDALAGGGTGTGIGSGSGGVPSGGNGNANASSGTGTGTGSGSGGSATGAAGNSISITAPLQYTPFQRNRSTGLGSIPVSGTYTGTPTSIEARFNGGSWQTIVASPSGGTFSGTLTNCPTGQGAVEVRFGNATATTASVATIGVTDIFSGSGQSNLDGRAAAAVQPGNANFVAVQWNGSAWVALVEVGGASSGDYFGKLSDYFDAKGIPPAFVNYALGSTMLANWLPGQSYYNTLKSTVQSAAPGGIAGHFEWIGESDGNNSTPQATFETEIGQFVDGIYADLGVKTLWHKISTNSIGTVKAAPIRAAVDNVAATNSHIIGVADENVWSSGDIHYQTAPEIAAVAAAAWSAIETAFYPAVAGGGTGTGTGSGSGGVATGGGSGNATGGTGTGTGSGSGGAATGGSSGSGNAAGGTGTGTGSGSGGAATGGSSGSFTFDAVENNTHSGPLNSVAVNWTWLGGTVGAITSHTNGTGTITSSGMTVNGLPAGPGIGIVKDQAGTVLAVQEGTVS